MRRGRELVRDVDRKTEHLARVSIASREQHSFSTRPDEEYASISRASIVYSDNGSAAFQESTVYLVELYFADPSLLLARPVARPAAGPESTCYGNLFCDPLSHPSRAPAVSLRTLRTKRSMVGQAGS